MDATDFLAFLAFNGYQHQNRRLTYDFEISQGNFTLPQPTFTIFPTGDPVADWVELAEEVMAVSFLLDHHNAVSLSIISGEREGVTVTDQSRQYPRLIGLMKNSRISLMIYWRSGLEM